MSQQFNIVAQLQLQGPANVNQVVKNLQRQLSNINANVNVKINQSALQTAQATSKSLNNLSKNSKAASSQLSNLSNASSKAGSSASASAKNFTQAATAAQSFGKQAALAVKRFAAFTVGAGIIGGFAVALKKGVSAAIDFERELIKVSQVSGSAMSSLSGLQNEITRLSVGLGVASAELIDVSRTLSQTGMSAREVQKALKALAQSSLAPTFKDMKNTAEGAISIMRQFGVSADDIGKKLGSINALAGQFAVEAQDLVFAIRRAGGAFKAAGGNLEELLALFTSVRATTRESAETIATGFRTIFTRMQRPKTIEFLRQAGVELQNLSGQFVGPYEAIRRLNRALQTLESTDPRFSQIVEELGGFRQVSKVIPLIQQFSTAQRALGTAVRGQGSLAKDAATAQQALAVQISKVREQFLALMREIAGSSAFKSFASTALNFATSMIKVGESIKPILPLLAGIGAVQGLRMGSQFIAGFAGGFRGQGGASNVGQSATASMTGQRAVASAQKQVQALHGNTQALVKTTSTLAKLNTSIQSLQRSLSNLAGVTRLGVASGAGAMGGRTRRRRSGFATGGIVPGSGSGDTVPAMLTPGEFVIKKSSVEKYGASNIARLNGGGRLGDVSRRRRLGGGARGSYYAGSRSKRFGKRMSGGGGKAFVFDFDDTLASTNAVVREGEEDPFGDFRGSKAGKFIRGARATKYAAMARKRSQRGFDIHVLTARPGDKTTRRSIGQFMRGVGAPATSVIGVGNRSQAMGGTANAKASVLGRLKGRYKKIIFLDDDQENVLAAGKVAGVRAVRARKARGGPVSRQRRKKFATGGGASFDDVTSTGKGSYSFGDDGAGATVSLGSHGKGTEMGVAAAFLQPQGLRRNMKLQIPIEQIMGKRRGSFSKTDLKSVRNRKATGKYLNVDLMSGSLSSKASKQFKASLRNNIMRSSERWAKKTLPSLKFNRGKFKSGYSMANPEQVEGNVFEAALSGLSDKPFNDERISKNAPFDFPRGLGGSMSKQFGLPATLPTDAKRTFNQDSIQSLSKKAITYYGEKLRQRLSRRDITGRKSGRTVSSTDERLKISLGLPKSATGADVDRALGRDGGRAANRLGLRSGSRPGTWLRRASGGNVPGSTDTIPALLTPGEFVVNRKSAQRVGYSALNSINKGRAQGFEKGGIVPQKFAAGSRGKGASKKGVSPMMGGMGIFGLLYGLETLASSVGGADEEFKKFTGAMMAGTSSFMIMKGTLDTFDLTGMSQRKTDNLMGSPLKSGESAGARMRSIKSSQKLTKAFGALVGPVSTMAAISIGVGMAIRSLGTAAEDAAIKFATSSAGMADANASEAAYRRSQGMKGAGTGTSIGGSIGSVVGGGIGMFFGGPAGAMAGAAIGSGVGSGIGAAVGYGVGSSGADMNVVRDAQIMVRATQTLKEISETMKQFRSGQLTPTGAAGTLTGRVQDMFDARMNVQDPAKKDELSSQIERLIPQFEAMSAEILKGVGSVEEFETSMGGLGGKFLELMARVKGIPLANFREEMDKAAKAAKKLRDAQAAEEAARRTAQSAVLEMERFTDAIRRATDVLVQFENLVNTAFSLGMGTRAGASWGGPGVRTGAIGRAAEGRSVDSNLFNQAARQIAPPDIAQKAIDINNIQQALPDMLFNTAVSTGPMDAAGFQTSFGTEIRDKFAGGGRRNPIVEGIVASLGSKIASDSGSGEFSARGEILSDPTKYAQDLIREGDKELLARMQELGDTIISQQEKLNSLLEKRVRMDRELIRRNEQILKTQQQIKEFDRSTQRGGLGSPVRSIAEIQSTDLARQRSALGGGTSTDMSFLAGDVGRMATTLANTNAKIAATQAKIENSPAGEAGALTLELERLNRQASRLRGGLEAVANSSEKLNALQTELAKKQASRDFQFNLIEGAVFGGPEEQADFIKTVTGMKMLSQGAVPQDLPPELRSMGFQGLRALGDTPLPMLGTTTDPDTGETRYKTGTDVRREAVERQVRSWAASDPNMTEADIQALIDSFMTAGNEEQAIQEEIRNTLNEQLSAQIALRDILSTEIQIADRHITEAVKIGSKAIVEALAKLEMDRLTAEKRTSEVEQDKRERQSAAVSTLQSMGIDDQSEAQRVKTAEAKIEQLREDRAQIQRQEGIADERGAINRSGGRPMASTATGGGYTTETALGGILKGKKTTTATRSGPVYGYTSDVDFDTSELGKTMSKVDADRARIDADASITDKQAARRQATRERLRAQFGDELTDNQVDELADKLETEYERTGGTAGAGGAGRGRYLEGQQKVLKDYIDGVDTQLQAATVRFTQGVTDLADTIGVTAEVVANWVAHVDQYNETLRLIGVTAGENFFSIFSLAEDAGSAAVEAATRWRDAVEAWEDRGRDTADARTDADISASRDPIRRRGAVTRTTPATPSTTTPPSTTTTSGGGLGGLAGRTSATGFGSAATTTTTGSASVSPAPTGGTASRFPSTTSTFSRAPTGSGRLHSRYHPSPSGSGSGGTLHGGLTDDERDAAAVPYPGGTMVPASSIGGAGSFVLGDRDPSNARPYPGETYRDYKARYEQYRNDGKEVGPFARPVLRVAYAEFGTIPDSLKKDYYSAGGTVGGDVKPSDGIAPAGKASKGTDTMLTALTPGEFVVNAASAQKHMGLLQAINNNSVDNLQKVKPMNGFIYANQGGLITKGGLEYLGFGGSVSDLDKTDIDVDPYSGPDMQQNSYIQANNTDKTIAGEVLRDKSTKGETKRKPSTDYYGPEPTKEDIFKGNFSKEYYDAQVQRLEEAHKKDWEAWEAARAEGTAPSGQSGKTLTKDHKTGEWNTLNIKRQKEIDAKQKRFKEAGYKAPEFIPPTIEQYQELRRSEILSDKIAEQRAVEWGIFDKGIATADEIGFMAGMSGMVATLSGVGAPVGGVLAVGETGADITSTAIMGLQATELAQSLETAEQEGRTIDAAAYAERMDALQDQALLQAGFIATPFIGGKMLRKTFKSIKGRYRHRTGVKMGLSPEQAEDYFGAFDTLRAEGVSRTEAKAISNEVSRGPQSRGGATATPPPRGGTTPPRRGTTPLTAAEKPKNRLTKPADGLLSDLPDSNLIDSDGYSVGRSIEHRIKAARQRLTGGGSNAQQKRIVGDTVTGTENFDTKIHKMKPHSDAQITDIQRLREFSEIDPSKITEGSYKDLMENLALVDPQQAGSIADSYRKAFALPDGLGVPSVTGVTTEAQLESLKRLQQKTRVTADLMSGKVNEQDVLDVFGREIKDTDGKVIRKKLTQQEANKEAASESFSLSKTYGRHTDDGYLGIAYSGGHQRGVSPGETTRTADIDVKDLRGDTVMGPEGVVSRRKRMGDIRDELQSPYAQPARRKELKGELADMENFDKIMSKEMQETALHENIHRSVYISSTAQQLGIPTAKNRNQYEWDLEHSTDAKDIARAKAEMKKYKDFKALSPTEKQARISREVKPGLANDIADTREARMETTMERGKAAEAIKQAEKAGASPREIRALEDRYLELDNLERKLRTTETAWNESLAFGSANISTRNVLGMPRTKTPLVDGPNNTSPRGTREAKSIAASGPPGGKQAAGARDSAEGVYNRGYFKENSEGGQHGAWIDGERFGRSGSVTVQGSDGKWRPPKTVEEYRTALGGDTVMGPDGSTPRQFSASDDRFMRNQIENAWDQKRYAKKVLGTIKRQMGNQASIHTAATAVGVGTAALAGVGLATYMLSGDNDNANEEYDKLNNPLPLGTEAERAKAKRDAELREEADKDGKLRKRKGGFIKYFRHGGEHKDINKGTSHEGLTAAQVIQLRRDEPRTPDMTKDWGEKTGEEIGLGSYRAGFANKTFGGSMRGMMDIFTPGRPLHPDVRDPKTGQKMTYDQSANMESWSYGMGGTRGTITPRILEPWEKGASSAAPILAPGMNLGEDAKGAVLSRQNMDELIFGKGGWERRHAATEAFAKKESLQGVNAKANKLFPRELFAGDYDLRDINRQVGSDVSGDIQPGPGERVSGYNIPESSIRISKEYLGENFDSVLGQGQSHSTPRGADASSVKFHNQSKSDGRVRASAKMSGGVDYFGGQGVKETDIYTPYNFEDGGWGDERALRWDDVISGQTRPEIASRMGPEGLPQINMTRMGSSLRHEMRHMEKNIRLKQLFMEGKITKDVMNYHLGAAVKGKSGAPDDAGQSFYDMYGKGARKQGGGKILSPGSSTMDVKIMRERLRNNPNSNMSTTDILASDMSDEEKIKILGDIRGADLAGTRHPSDHMDYMATNDELKVRLGEIVDWSAANDPNVKKALEKLGSGATAKDIEDVYRNTERDPKSLSMTMEDASANILKFKAFMDKQEKEAIERGGDVPTFGSSMTSGFMATILNNKTGEIDKDKLHALSRGMVLLRSGGGAVTHGTGQNAGDLIQSSDTRLTVLTPGEFVVNKKSAQDNREVLETINSGAQFAREGSWIGGAAQSALNVLSPTAGLMAQQVTGNQDSGGGGGMDFSSITSAIQQGLQGLSFGSLESALSEFSSNEKLSSSLNSFSEAFGGDSVIKHELSSGGVTVNITGLDSLAEGFKQEIMDIVAAQISSAKSDMLSGQPIGDMQNTTTGK